MKHSKYLLFFLFVLLIVIVSAAVFYALFLRDEKEFEYAGKYYSAGERFPSDDGCNTCSFDKEGKLACTLMACNDNNPLYKDSVDIEFEYSEGYRYKAVVKKPTPCDIINTDVVIRESFPEQVDFNIQTETSGGICIQVISEETIEGEIRVSKEAVIDVYFNGELVKAAANK